MHHAVYCMVHILYLIDISKTRPKLLEKYIGIFERYIQKYPRHANYEIWKRYISVLEDSLVNQ